MTERNENFGGAPLYRAVTDYVSRGVYPFHMPGHKRNPEFLPPNLAQLDVTEIEGMDVLHKPIGAIKALQEKIARVYGADESFILVNGSSSGIVASVCAACGEGDTLYLPRFAHQSVFHGLALSGARPEYRHPEKADAAVFVSPDYFGTVADIRETAARVHKRGGVVIVDEAHGAHFPFHEIFPPGAMERGADISVVSFHKTLPAFSQTAALHVRGNRVDRDRLRYYLRVMQTSSPSYLFMASVDYMLSKLAREPRHFESYAENLTRLRNALPGTGENAAVTLISRPEIEIGKLNLLLRTHVGGEELSRIMADEYKIEMEMAWENRLLAMTSVADTPEGFKRLERAVNELNGRLPFKSGNEREYAPTSECANAPRGEFSPRGDGSSIPDTALTPAEALRRETEAVPTREAAGRVAGEFYTEYPPGVPLVVPGEIITNETAARIKDARIKVITR